VAPSKRLRSPVATTTQALQPPPATRHRLSPGSRHEMSLHVRRPTHRGAPTMAETSLSIRESPQGVQATMQTRGIGIATGDTRDPPGRSTKRQLREAHSCRPRRATEATHPPLHDRTGFPGLSTERCDRPLPARTPRGSRRLRKSLDTERGPRERTDDRGTYSWGERRHLRTRPCGPIRWRQHPPWG
jgi:hypothetical protein